MTRRPPRLPTGDERSLPVQARSLTKRAALLDAGRRLFAEKGYEATSIEEITDAAGTAAGGFYTYFESKRQLLLVLMNELLERLHATDLKPKVSANLRDGLRAFLLEVFETDLAYYGVIRAWHEATLSDASLADARRAVEGWTQARILAIFERLHAHPKARADADLRTFARLMDRHFWDLLGRGGTLSKARLKRETTIAADVIYHYLFRDGA